MSEAGLIDVARVPVGGGKPYKNSTFAEWVEGGLALHEEPWDENWIVTHVASGRQVVEGYTSARAGRAGMRRLLAAGDWTRSATVCKRDKALKAAAMAEREKVKK